VDRASCCLGLWGALVTPAGSPEILLFKISFTQDLRSKGNEDQQETSRQQAQRHVSTACTHRIATAMDASGKMDVQKYNSTMNSLAYGNVMAAAARDYQKVRMHLLVSSRGVRVSWSPLALKVKEEAALGSHPGRGEDRVVKFMRLPPPTRAAHTRLHRVALRHPSMSARAARSGIAATWDCMHVGHHRNVLGDARTLAPWQLARLSRPRAAGEGGMLTLEADQVS
jgi:hypothetical protein